MNLFYFINSRRQKIAGSSSGFTLVETLIAVAVLMIAVAGPLTIANKSLTAALYSRNQSIASYLAQEQMEFVKNIKDNFLRIPIASGGGWTNFINLLSASCLNSNNKCGIDISGVGSNTIIKCTTPTSCLLYSSSSGYKLGSGTTNTLFTRYFYIEQVLNGISDTTEYQITTVVSWKDGLLPSEVRMHGEISNGIR